MSFETDFNKKFKPLLKKLNAKEAKLRTLVLNSLKSGSTSVAYWNKLRQEVSAIYSEMNVMFAAWSKDEIPIRYRKSLKQINSAILARATITNTPVKTISEMLASKGSQTLATMLYMEANDTFVSALNAGRSNIIRFTRVTQQAILAESEINLAIMQGLAEGGNLGKAARILTGEFWQKAFDSVENERFVQAGRYRYKPSYYAKMVARTKFHEAQSVAAMTQAKNYGTDLVQVSSHNTKTAICIPFEGKIYSISGNNKMFPPLFDTPPYHPNCLHLLYPTFVSGMEAQGTLESFSDFSKGKIDAPPIPKSFIPISERAVV